MFLREYIETYEKTQRELVLTFEEIAKELTANVKAKKKVKLAGKK